MISGTAVENSGLVLLARVRNSGGDYIQQSDLSSINCAVYDAISGNELATPSVDISSSVYDTLQTDARWEEDDVGYNFAHTLPASALSSGSTRYRIEYKFQPSSGEQYYVVYDVTATEVMGD